MKRFYARLLFLVAGAGVVAGSALAQAPNPAKAGQFYNEAIFLHIQGKPKEALT